jgi:hypothetical protein
MKIVSDTKLIKRNKRIGSITTFVALGVLGIGLYFSFTKPEEISITFGALLLGFLLTQVGIYFGNRWGRSPRPDELLTAALKGLENSYTLYHYTAGVPHLLVGPTGIWGLIPVSVGGKISFDESKMRFRQKGGSFYFKLFGGENLGRPEVEAQYIASDFAKYAKKKFPDIQVPEVNPILIFTNKKAELDIDNSPIPAVTLEKLKDFIRKRSKEEPVALSTVQAIQKKLPKEEK